MATVLARHPQPSVDHARLGVLLFIVSEAMLFASFFAAYFFLRGLYPTWPPSPEIHRPELPLITFNTLILLSSSLTMHWATLGIRVGNVARLKIGVLVTLLLGAIFLSIQGWEFAHNNFSIQDGVFGSTFYTLTGFHGAHVFVGLLLLAMVLNRASQGHFSQERHNGVENVGYYWHFVDVVWLCLFTVVYVL